MSSLVKIENRYLVALTEKDLETLRNIISDRMHETAHAGGLKLSDTEFDSLYNEFKYLGDLRAKFTSPFVID